MTKHVAEFRASGRRQELEAALGAGVLLMLALGGVALAVSAAVALLAPGLAASGDREDFQLGLLAIGASQLIRYPAMAYAATLVGYQRLDLMNAAQIVTIVSFPIGAVIAVEAGTGVLGVSVAFAASLTAGGFAWLLLLRRLDRDLSMRPRLTDRAGRRRVLTFGSFALFADAMAFVAMRMDTVVIAAIRGAAAAAPFGAAVRLQGGLQSLVTPFLDILLPMVSDLKARRLDSVIVERLLAATRAAAQITIPMAVGVALFAPDVTEVWLGADAPDVTADIIAVLVLAQVPALTGMPAQNVLIGLGRVKVIGALAAVEAALNLGISITLVATVGAIGAAIGTLVAAAALSPLRWPLVCRATGYSTRRYLRGTFVPAAAASAPGIAAMLALYLLMEEGPARLALGLGGGLALCVATAALQLGPRRILSEARGLRADLAA